MQQWLTSVLFFLINNFFGSIGLLVFEIIVLFLIEFVLYKLCKLISDNKKLSCIISVIISAIIVILGFIDIRPQIITYLILLLFIYIIECYLKTKNKKILFVLPILSILQINFHAAMWCFLFVFSIPFLIESLVKKRKDYYFIILLLVSFLCGLINPYGINSITYILKSSNYYINEWVGEMHHPDGLSLTTILMLIILFINFIIYLRYYKKNNSIKVSYLLLLFGSLALSQVAMKSYIFFFVFALYPLAYYLKDFKINTKWLIYLRIIYTTIIVGSFITVLAFSNHILIDRDQNIQNAGKYLKDNYDIENIQMYNSYYTGPYLEYIGIKTYIDSRAELFLKKMNKKDDIFEENYKLRTGHIKIQELIKKYNFTHLLFSKSDIYLMEDDINYNGNQSLIQQMVSCLLDNAVKYSDENGQIRLIVKSNIKKLKLKFIILFL